MSTERRCRAKAVSGPIASLIMTYLGKDGDFANGMMFCAAYLAVCCRFEREPRRPTPSLQGEEEWMGGRPIVLATKKARVSPEPLEYGRREAPSCHVLVCVELVADADADRVEIKILLSGATRDQVRRGFDAVELRVAILGASRQVVGDGVLNTSAKSPAPLRIVKRLGVRAGGNAENIASRERGRVGVLDVGESQTARDIDEGAIEGHTGAGAERSLEVDVA